MTKQAVKRILIGILKFIMVVTIGFFWVCSVFFFALLPSLLGAKGNTLGFISLFIPLLGPFIFMFYKNRKDALKEVSNWLKRDWVEDGRNFVGVMWALIATVGTMLGILILVFLSLLALGAVFYWLAGLSVTALLILILVVLILK